MVGLQQLKRRARDRIGQDELGGVGADEELAAIGGDSQPANGVVDVRALRLRDRAARADGEAIYKAVLIGFVDPQKDHPAQRRDRHRPGVGRFHGHLGERAIRVDVKGVEGAAVVVAGEDTLMVGGDGQLVGLVAAAPPLPPVG